MSVERKCNNCGNWSDFDICSNCGFDLNPKRIRVKKIREQKEKKKAEAPEKLEAFLAKWKGAKNPFLKITYWIGYSVWTIYMGILSIIAFIIAWGPG
tara:strand:- start:501 stop:791 length:291 start_codon:yes stop_codon:yes gene_type:complete